MAITSYVYIGLSLFCALCVFKLVEYVLTKLFGKKEKVEDLVAVKIAKLMTENSTVISSKIDNIDSNISVKVENTNKGISELLRYLEESKLEQKESNVIFGNMLTVLNSIKTGLQQ